MQAEHARDKLVATVITRGTEVNVDATLDPVRAIATELNEDIRQRADKDIENGSAEDVLSAMVDIPK
jgi:hypothetical protein